MPRKTIRIVVLGDENVGKSWLIHTIYSEVSSNVEKTLKKVILPPQMCLYSREVFTELVDTSVEMDVGGELRACDLALLVYDVSDPDTIARIDSDWLPKINSINPKLPIILVGNKMDKKQLQFQVDQQYTKIKDILKKVTKRYKNVQMGIECSAFYDRNVKSVLNCAQRAVLYPLSPLYDLEEKRITGGFRRALVRVFRILDRDFDGRLYDSELNALQERVFQSQLNAEDIKAIKQVILRQLQVQQHDYIQLKGFIALQKKVIQMLKIQICWSILRYFNYNDDLKISINTQAYQIDESSGESVQLSSQSINFLIQIYNLSRKCPCIEGEEKKERREGRDSGWESTKEKEEGREQGRDGTESQVMVDSIFYSCPEVWLEEFKGKGCVESLEKFLGLWSLAAFLDARRCYEDLLYLGFQQSIQQAFNRRRSKKAFNEFQRIKDNKVFSILLIDNSTCQRYLDALFLQSQPITVFSSQNRPIFTYNRHPQLFTNQNISKTLLLFKVKRQDLKEFFKSNWNNQTAFARTIDLVVEFQEKDKRDRGDRERDGGYVRNIIPDYMLYRVVTCEEVQAMKADELPKLDLTKFPIRYDEKAYQPFFNQVIYKSFLNIEQGLSKQKISSLKQQNNQKKNKIILSVASVAITALIIGSIVFQKFNLKLWK